LAIVFFLIAKSQYCTNHKMKPSIYGICGLGNDSGTQQVGTPVKINQPHPEL